MTNPNRVSKGVPTGGEFATGERAENADLEVESSMPAAKPGAKFEVGQPVMITRAYGRADASDEYMVVKTGRKYVYVGRTLNDYKPRKFDIETGQEDTGGYSGGNIYTPEEWAGRTRRLDAVKRLRGLGVTDGAWGTGERGRTFGKASADQLERIAEILEESAPPEESEPSE